nr:hypothetical protein B0A51_18400 [Rachicladosporium sp. CCFEE 5018]
MEAILSAHEQLASHSNLSLALADVDKTIALLESARESVASKPSTAPLALAKLKQPLKASFDRLDDDLKDVNKALKSYERALDKKFKAVALPTASTEVMEEKRLLVLRAIVMHLLREGRFEVADILVKEMNEGGKVTEDWFQELANWQAGDGDMSMVEESQGSKLQAKFTEMYHILSALRNGHDLSPAISWAREHSQDLALRGSNLEFNLARLKFIELYTSEDLMSDEPWEGPMAALEYAREVFPGFGARYGKEVAGLMGSLAFPIGEDADGSPYSSLFGNGTAWEEASSSFTTEFCSLLGLPSTSALYTAVTAGGIALPILSKLSRIIAATRGSWTSVNELPVETPLPVGFQFHSVFVCPVSKEQGTDENPPMLLNCGHVLARESLEAHARGKTRMKCPYCPGESAPRDARRVFI